MPFRLSENDVGRNINELNDFRNFWKESADYPPANRNNNRCRMPVKVRYRWGQGRETRFRTLFIAFVGAGPNDGAIELEETGKIDVHNFHLGFDPGFQTYKYKKGRHSLVVTGESEKMCGPYRVRIEPLLDLRSAEAALRQGKKRLRR